MLDTQAVRQTATAETPVRQPHPELPENEVQLSPSPATGRPKPEAKCSTEVGITCLGHRDSRLSAVEDVVLGVSAKIESLEKALAVHTMMLSKLLHLQENVSP
jgi:hypothetical protein